ncbi:putative amino-acid metabolite efflux pump [Hartmannibacter diazotrophicus]|uniref:Putative amino-acid metabolite efflux pump n=1 Tax=Hartmannibacter diazotrophicus TaxID=1482074 RepID=A0A2C9DD39_9HYPH|nr:EamA family transporter [Hartmannibacter diazotrophicus]SON58217.1 putative amino-acid metabolite efflux pump [Hartmannibacter diazotrophicus]
MKTALDLALTALAPVIWGTSYLVATTWLAGFDPLLVALLRALPAGLLLILIVRRLPAGIWWVRVFCLGALNFSIFWWMLFVAAYRLPGGLAATVGAVQPLVVVFLARLVLGTPVRAVSVVAAVTGMLGVALLILTPEAALDPLGVAAGFAGAASMAAGTVLTRRWQPSVPLVTFTAWQLAAGGLLLLPALWWIDLGAVHFTAGNLAGLAYLGLVGAALTYLIWFRGLARLDPTLVSPLGFLSPVTAVLLGWLVAGENFTALQTAGLILVAASLLAAQIRIPRRVPTPAEGIAAGAQQPAL